MKQRPILMSAPMVRAVLDGSKTQTRRIVKRPKRTPLDYILRPDLLVDKFRTWWQNPTFDRVGESQECPYGQPGDRLWVRETWKYWDWTEDGMPSLKYAADDTIKFFDSCTPEDWSEKLNDVWAELSDEENYQISRAARDHKWRPSIFMPRWASRITLEIVSVRVERLNDISEEDSKDEGVEPMDGEREDDYSICPVCGGSRLCNGVGENMGVIFDQDCTTCDTHKKRYKHLWESINAPGSWDANTWVWVIEFKRVA